MAKQHPSPSPPGAAFHASPAATSLPNSQLSLQLRQDLAKLAHKDPDTRRSSMEALKGFIEGELDAQKMPTFLEQISGETNKGSGSYAISLFVEVVRVHKQLAVPFIPRIMTAVLRSLASSSGGTGCSNNLHQACAKVVSAVTRYAIEPASSSSRSSSSTDVLDSLCQPLLGLLCSNVEPVAVGSATCLQAIVEAENWKLATPELVHDVCGKSCIALVDKGKHTVMHVHLVRSLTKFNPGALQEYGASLLKVGVQILVSGNMATCGSWQQRVAAAQLLGTLLDRLDEQILASELIPTMEALNCCRLDKVTTVRQAVGESLTIAKSLASEINPLLLQKGVPEARTALSTPVRCRLPDSRKRDGRKKSCRRMEEPCASTATSDDIDLGSQESQAVSYTSSPSSSITTVSTPLGSLSSDVQLSRSPLYAVNQSPVFPPSSLERNMTESEIPYLLAHLKPSDVKGNAALVGKMGELLVASKSDDLSYTVNGSRNKLMKEVVDDEEVMHVANDNIFTTQHEQEGLLSSDTDDAEAELGSDVEFGTNNFLREPPKSDGVWEQQAAARSLECPHGCKIEGAHEQSRDLMKDSEQPATCAQVSKKCMTAQDFLIFSTPRRLVRSLQLVSSTPGAKCSPKRDQGVEVDYETLSESGWSVRDNPIAGDSEDDSSPRKLVVSSKSVLMQSKDCSCCDGGSASSMEDEKRIDCLQFGDTVNSKVGLSRESTSIRGSRDVPEKEDSGCGIVQGGCPKLDQSDALEKEESYGLVKKKTAGLKASRDWASFARRMHDYAELFLFGALFVMLAFTALIAVLNCIRGQYDPDMLVPT